MGILDQIIGSMIQKVLTDEEHSELRQAVWNGIKQGAKEGLHDAVYGADDSIKKLSDR